MEEAVPDLLWQRREPEIGDLELAVLVEEEVLGLDVTVGDAVLVAEVEGEDELVEIIPGRREGETAAVRELREKLPSVGQLHH